MSVIAPARFFVQSFRHGFCQACYKMQKLKQLFRKIGAALSASWGTTKASPTTPVVHSSCLNLRNLLRVCPNFCIELPEFFSTSARICPRICAPICKKGLPEFFFELPEFVPEFFKDLPDFFHRFARIF